MSKVREPSSFGVMGIQWLSAHRLSAFATGKPWSSQSVSDQKAFAGGVRPLGEAQGAAVRA